MVIYEYLAIKSARLTSVILEYAQMKRIKSIYQEK